MTGKPTNAISAQPCQGGLDDQQIKQWREQGFVFVSQLLPQTLIASTSQKAGEQYPQPNSNEADQYVDFGSKGALTFPSQVSELNEVTLHPALLGSVAALLDEPVNDLRLTQSDLWAKYGRKTYGRENSKDPQDNQDQRIHVDYPNHTLAHPTPWHRPEAVEIIIYFDDVEETGGSTALVPRNGQDDPAYPWPIVDSPGIGDLRYINDRASAETYFANERPGLEAWRQSLYEKEKVVWFKPGDILLYRHDTWHRGTPMIPGSRRLVQNLTYRRASAEWISTLHIGWAWSAYRDNKFLERLIAGASLDQRAILGFPQPGSHYWCEETVAAVEARYGMFGMDMTPYR